MEKISKYRLEVILFIINAIYMILELVASRILSPYFGNTNIVWTSIIGIILLSTSIGNYLGGIIADKTQGNEEKLKTNVNIILMITGIYVFIIPIIQKNNIELITIITENIKMGAIISTICLFFVPSMFIGMLTPVILKLKMKELGNVGKTAGNISAIATLGSIIGTFIGGFVLIPSFGSTQILFVLSIIIFLLIFLTKNKEKIFDKVTILSIILIVVNIICFCVYTRINDINAKKVLEGKTGIYTNLDTQYGKITIKNGYRYNYLCRELNIDRGNESATFVDEDKCNELVNEYTKYYDLMFKSDKNINQVLMIGGAGYSYPKYYISHYSNKKMDVVEIDEKVTKIAKKYFFLDKLFKEFDLDNNDRLNLITEDGRVYINKNQKKYDAILNDAFSGLSPVKTLATKEAIIKIHDSLNDGGIYLTNVISSLSGENSRFIKAEVNTLRKVFKNVYVIPCKYKDQKELVQNNMVVATDQEIIFENQVNLEIDEKNEIIITDDYCPVEDITPKI